MTISIILPVYNAAKYLDKCLCSILSQSYRNFELICVNDGSTDRSIDILEKYACYDSRIRILNNENGGVSIARNRGLDYARGKYIAFIDSDDYVEKDYLLSLIEPIQNGGNYDLVCSGLHDFNDSDIIQSVRLRDDIFNLDTSNQILSFLNLPLNSSPVAKLYNRDIIECNHIRFRPEISLGEDRDFNLRLFGFCNSVRSIAYVGYYYRKDVIESLTHKKHNGQFVTDYESIILTKNIFSIKGFYDKDAEVFIARKLYFLLLDKITEVTFQNHCIDSDGDFQTVIGLLNTEWNILKKNRHQIQSNGLLKNLLIYKKFKILSLVLRVKYKIKLR